MNKFNSSRSPVFCRKLEDLIFKSGEQLNKHTLQKFLTIEQISEFTESLLEENEWKIFRLATASIFLENKLDDLLTCFLITIGNFINFNDENCDKIEEALLDGFFYALPGQIEKLINIINKLREQHILNDDLIPFLFYEKLINNITTVREKTFQSENG